VPQVGAASNKPRRSRTLVQHGAVLAAANRTRQNDTGERSRVGDALGRNHPRSESSLKTDGPAPWRPRRMDSQFYKAVGTAVHRISQPAATSFGVCLRVCVANALGDRGRRAGIGKCRLLGRLRALRRVGEATTRGQWGISSCVSSRCHPPTPAVLGRDYRCRQVHQLAGDDGALSRGLPSLQHT